MTWVRPSDPGLSDPDPFSLRVTLQLGILLALLCAFFSNLGFFFKHRGCNEAPPVDIRHPLRTAKGLWGSKWFAIGMVIGGGGWGLHVAAISLAPLSVVQVVLSGGVVLIAVMADRIFGFEVGPRQWWGLALTAVGLILLGVTMPAPGGAHSTFSLAAMVAFEATLFGLGALLILGRRAGAPAEHHGVMLAAASGILFGVCNVAVKALSGMVGDAGLLGTGEPLAARRGRRLGHRVLRLRPQPAGRRGRRRDRHHRHGGQHLLHRRRHRRLRRPAPRRRRRHGAPGAGVRHGHRRLGADPGAGPLGFGARRGRDGLAPAGRQTLRSAVSVSTSTTSSSGSPRPV
jgi:drug/metabolite transporter (DMT)-like permease